MSHFTHMKTHFQNLFYLKKALNRLNIDFSQQNSTALNSDTSQTNLIISQSNGYNIEFSWNGQEYELVVDMSFWEQAYPIESFMDRIAQQYAGEVVIW